MYLLVPYKETTMQEKEEKTNNEEFQEEMTSKDYGFIVSDEGELKAVFVPRSSIYVPQEVRKVFKIFGIKSPETVDVHTVH